MPIDIPTDFTPELVPLSWLIGEGRAMGVSARARSIQSAFSSR